MSPTSVQATSQDPAANRTVAVAAAGTLLVLAAFSAALTSVGDSTRAVHGGISGATKTAVLGALAGGKAMTAGEVAAATGLGRASVSTTLSKLAKSGEVAKAQRGYQLTDSSKSGS